MVEEAELEAGEGGLQPLSDGWFIVNVDDARWVTSAAFGADCIFESRSAPFAALGVTIAVLEPGRPNARYHREPGNQEDFLVLQGECLVLIEEQERRLRAWDFVHCPAGTDHVFVGAGDRPCIILMVGSRNSDSIFYPRSELALRHGAGVEADTAMRDEAYGDCPRHEPGGAERWRALVLG